MTDQEKTVPETSAEFAAWANGYGVIRHTAQTQSRIATLANRVALEGMVGDGVSFYELLSALDRLTSAGLWLVVHETYARNVHLDGRPLSRDEFKPKPDGHTGGSLNMVPAYAAYLAANVLSAHTRGWLMGQGHCVAAVDSLNLLTGNLLAAHSERYSVSDEGLTRYVRDFYSYKLNDSGAQDSPLGSHVNHNTAGGLAEGGYLGFAELQYVHMPLPGEKLVVFLSDGAFEEQRGSDWAPRWWRADDCGSVAPIMISNGRRIDQRTTMSQQGGVDWFCRHLELNGFDPIEFDGRDPAAFLWAIFEIEARLAAAAEDVRSGKSQYPVRLPYGIAVAPKGAGFPGEGTNLAHNLPLLANPFLDAEAAERFNAGARKLWVPPGELGAGISVFQRHVHSGRRLERDHVFVDRRPQLSAPPTIPSRELGYSDRSDPAEWTFTSPMAAVDEVFSTLVRENAHLRPRVGNPDEMKSNRLLKTLETLKFRVTVPEPGIPESLHGAVITALNEEAVAAAALANKAGINLIHTYEAFGTKMHGVVRQELIFARNCSRSGRPQNWLSVPLVLTSHTWENGKNEQSHQDPSLAEALLGESISVSRVLFPVDFNSAAATTARVFETRGQIWALVVPKADTIPNILSPEEAKTLACDGGLRLDWASHEPEKAQVILAAIGSYQLREVLTAARRLKERGLPHLVVCIEEPARFRTTFAEDELERRVPDAVMQSLFPPWVAARLFVTHTRPHSIWGIFGPRQSAGKMSVLGYVNEGGTLSTSGMLFINSCSWAHCVAEVAQLLGVPGERFLTEPELAALKGQLNPHGVIVPLADA